MRCFALALLLAFAPMTALANGDDDDSAACDDDDSATAVPDDAATYGWLCGVSPTAAAPAPLALLLALGGLGVRRRRE
jgi:MYXO-CTERM domain-containing protein